MIFWILFLLLILLGIWFCIEQHVLRVRKQTLSLEHLPAGWDGVSLLQITDLHHRQMGRGNCRIIRQAQQLQPDVIVLTGDMISRDMRDFHEISSFLQALSKISPTYLCTGNHELDLPSEVQQEFWAMAEQAGCHPLRNETVPLEKSGCPPLYLGGSRTGVWDLSGRQPRIPALAALYGGRPDTGFGHTAGLHGAAGT